MELELIQRTQSGDDEAYQTLIDLHREAVFRLAYLMLNHREDAQDITQEAFLRAYRNIHRFDTTRSFRPWILSITANLCRNHRRSIGRYWHMLGRVTRQFTTEQTLSTEQQVIQQTEVARVLEQIRQLTATEQEIIYLRYFLDLSVEETAHTLEIRPGTVKSRLHRAIQQLRLLIESEA